MIRLKNFSSMIFIFFLLNLLPVVFNQHESDPCPQNCKCSSTVVDCGNNHFKLLPNDLPDWTEVLYLNDNPLESFAEQPPPMIFSPKNLTYIDFTRTDLRFIDSNVLNLIFTDIVSIEHSLVKLKFDENSLSSFPHIHNISNLRFLSLSKNNHDQDSVTNVDLTSIYPRLEFLDFSNNDLKHIQKNFLSQSSSKPHSSLTHLILQSNKIDMIEDGAFESFPNLKTLRLSKNNIAVIAKSWLKNLNHLYELDLNYNQINSIGILAFEDCKSLQTLKIRRNKLNELPDGAFWGLSRLQKLYLDHNNISEIKLGWTYGLTSLKELTLKHNSIQIIHDDSWRSCSSTLMDLNLNFNKLQHIRKYSFDKLPFLQVLKLSMNQISNIDANALQSLKRLETLDMSGNKLSWAVENSNETFAGLQNLKELRLDQNQIRLIYKQTFIGLSKILSLNLSSNPISSIQKDAFDWLENLQQLHLENIDLLCDCTVKWLFHWLQTSKVRFAKNVRCKHPHELSLQPFIDIDKDKLKCQDFLKPYLIDDFDNLGKPIAAIKQKNMTFYCKVATSSVDKIFFEWFKDNQIVNHDRAKFSTLAQAYSDNVTHYTNVLNIANIQDVDQGEYHCMASNNFGSVYSSKFSVNVYVMPYFVKKPQNITVKVGHTAKLECAAKGQPNPVISWQKEGDYFPAAIERRMHVMPADDVFFIVEAKKSDTGLYSCNATNEAGFIVSTAFLNVIEPPSFVRKMLDKKFAIGSTVSLECMAAGIPLPLITWRKDGNLLQPTERHFFTAEGQLLIIVKARLSDEGTYTCNISNSYGMVQDSSYLEIIEKSNQLNSEVSLHSLVSAIKAHALIVFIVICCVVLTSIAWILAIFYMRHRQLKQNILEKKDVSLHGSSYQIEINNDKADSNSIISSAEDTGIEGSCQSYEDETDVDFSTNFNNFYNYNSLPRYCSDLNYQLPVLINNQHHSLPRKGGSAKELYSCKNDYHNHINQYKYNRTSVLSSKKEKLLAKKRIHHLMKNDRNIKQSYIPDYSKNHLRQEEFLNYKNSENVNKLPQKFLRTFSVNEVDYCDSFP